MEWSDRELDVALVELGRVVAWRAEQGQAADVPHWLSVVLAGERDRRRALARAVDDAVDGSPARWLANASERRTARRRGARRRRVD